MDYLTGIANSAMAVPSFIGKSVDLIFDGGYGVGTLHQRLLQMGGDRIVDTIVHIAVPTAISFYLLEECRGVIANKKNPKQLVAVGYVPFVHGLAIALLWIGGIYELRFGLLPLTAETAKRIAAKAILCGFDVQASTAFWHIDGQPSSSKVSKAIGGLYLAARVGDIVATGSGAITQGLVRFNFQPLIHNFSSYLPRNS